MFLILSSVGVGYVIWDIIDQLPKPITIEMARAALRQEPGRIADALALSVYISFGPPAGVDLMLEIWPETPILPKPLFSWRRLPM